MPLGTLHLCSNSCAQKYAHSLQRFRTSEKDQNSRISTLGTEKDVKNERLNAVNDTTVYHLCGRTHSAMWIPVPNADPDL